MELDKSLALDELCEEVYRRFLSLLGRGLKNVVIYISSARSPDWMKVSSCVLSRNIVATVEVYASDTLSKESILEKCVEVVEVPVAPPTSHVRECR